MELYNSSKNTVRCKCYFFTNAKYKLLGIIYPNKAIFLSELKDTSCFIYFNKTFELFESPLFYAKKAVAHLNFRDTLNALKSIDYALALNVKKNKITAVDLITVPDLCLDYVLHARLLSDMLSLIPQSDKNEDYIHTIDSVWNIVRNEMDVVHDKLNLSEKAIEYYELVVNHYLTKSDFPKSFYYAEQNRANVLRADLANNGLTKIAGIPDSLQEEERQLKIYRNFYETRKPAGYETKLFEISEKLSAIETLYKTRYADAYARAQIPILEAETIQSALQPDEALLEYFIGNDYYTVFVLTRTGLQQKTMPKPDNFDDILSNYRRAIVNDLHEEPNKFASASHAAYQVLIQPIAELIQAKKRLIIIDDGKVGTVSLDALIVTPKSAKTFSELDYLVKHFQITHHYSASLWCRARTENRNNTAHRYGLTAYAPVFDDKTGVIIDSTFDDSIRSSEYYKPLPNSENEVVELNRKFSKKHINSKIFTHAHATEQNFTDHINTSRIVHVSTHGEYDDIYPERSHLRFYDLNPADTVSDNKLYLKEISVCQSSAELAVLASCSSGMGKIAPGEGIIALPEAFLIAGVQNVVYSLWAINDKATSDFMPIFYESLMKSHKNPHLDYAASLQHAKLMMLQHTNKDYANPKFWAGITAIGR